MLGNLEDAIPADAKQAARDGFIAMARATDFGTTGLWTRINALNSPWALDDITEIVAAVGNKLDVVMLPKVDGAWDIHYLDQLLAQLEARHGCQEADPDPRHPGDRARASTMSRRSRPPRPRMHGISLGPADLAASRAMKTTRVGGGHPDYKVLADAAQPAGPRRTIKQDLWHYTIAKMVDACAAAGIKPFYGPFGDFSDPDACEAQFRNAFLMGCAGAWSLHPIADRHRQERVLARPGRSGLRARKSRRHAGRHRRGHDRRQDAGRRHLEAGQGGGRPGAPGRSQGPGWRRITDYTAYRTPQFAYR